MLLSRRKEPRFSHRFPLRLIWDRRACVAMTEDVSFQGLGIRTNASPPLRLLVRVDLELPGSGRRLSMHAYVAHTTLDQGCCQPYIGLHLYGISDEDRAVWERYVRSVRQASPPQMRYPPSAVVAVETPTIAQLHLVRAAAAAGGRAFCKTSLAFAEQDPIHLVLVHPESGRLFLLRGTVVRRVDKADRVGVVVDLVKLDPEERLRLGLFVNPEAPVESLRPSETPTRTDLRTQ